MTYDCYLSICDCSFAREILLFLQFYIPYANPYLHNEIKNNLMLRWNRMKADGVMLYYNTIERYSDDEMKKGSTLRASMCA